MEDKILAGGENAYTQHTTQYLQALARVGQYRLLPGDVVYCTSVHQSHTMVRRGRTFRNLSYMLPCIYFFLSVTGCGPNSNSKHTNKIMQNHFCFMSFVGSAGVLEYPRLKMRRRNDKIRIEIQGYFIQRRNSLTIYTLISWKYSY